MRNLRIEKHNRFYNGKFNFEKAFMSIKMSPGPEVLPENFLLYTVDE